MRAMGNQTIKALVALLAEEKSETLNIVRDKLREIGREAIPELEKAAREGSPQNQRKARDLIREIRLESLYDLMVRLAADREPDLEEGVFLLPRLKYPEFKEAPYRLLLDAHADALGRRLPVSREDPQAIEAFRSYCFEEIGFAGNQQDYYDPDNSFVHRVIERKKGIPISLATVLLLIGKRLSLPLFGVGLPRHFLLGWNTEAGTVYLNPFNAGRGLSRKEIESSLAFSGIPFRPEYLDPATPSEVIARTIRNLIYTYEYHHRDIENADWLRQVHQLYNA